MKLMNDMKLRLLCVYACVWVWLWLWLCVGIA